MPIEFNNLEEFTQQLQDVIKEYPITTKKHVNRMGTILRKKLMKDSPDSGKEHNKKINKSWHKKVLDTFDHRELDAQIWSTAPHIGLVERGHKIVNEAGQVTGFVQGKHFVEQICLEAEDDIKPQLNKLMRDIQRQVQQ